MLFRNPHIPIAAGVDQKILKDLYWNNIIPPYKYLNVSTEYLWKAFLYNLVGVGKYTMQICCKILETSLDRKISLLNPFQRYLFFFFYLFLFPKNFSRRKRFLYKLVFWYNLYSYKGWRHLFGYPVNGQRTWSNNKTRYRMPNKLYDYLKMCFAKKYGIFTKTNLKISFMAEHINLLWGLEWYIEWLSAHQIFAATKQKTKFFRLKVNYRYLMNFQISTPYSIEHKKKKKNRKKIKTEFTIGFKTFYIVSLFSKKKHLFKHLL